MNEPYKTFTLTIFVWVVSLFMAFAVESWVSMGFDWVTSDEGKYSRIGVLLTSTLTAMYVMRKKEAKQ